jgi:hypothetical protein
MGSIPVTIIGVMTYSDLSVGGGPMPGGPSVSHPIAPGGPPPGYWGGVAPPLPTHPIAPGGPPLGFWGGVAPPYPDQGLPQPPPGYWGGVAPPLPTHPIAPGGPPLGIWGGGNVPMPTPPIYLPPGTIPGAKPEHPIYIPPSIWPSPGVPTHPIALPPSGTDGQPEVLANWDVKAAWTPNSGWVTVIVPTESHPGVPTPS